MAEPGKAVFLSYASDDADAAARIRDALQAAGVEVWFDKNELRGGDAWDREEHQGRCPQTQQLPPQPAATGKLTGRWVHSDDLSNGVGTAIQTWTPSGWTRFASHGAAHFVCPCQGVRGFGRTDNGPVARAAKLPV